MNKRGYIFEMKDTIYFWILGALVMVILGYMFIVTNENAQNIKFEVDMTHL